MSANEWSWDWFLFHLVVSWCLVDLVPDLTGLVKDAWLVTDYGFPLLSPVAYQITSLGLAHGIKNDRCKGTEYDHVWYRARWACPFSGPAENTGNHRGQDILHVFLILSTDWLLILIPKKKENGRDWLCCFSFEEKIHPMGFQNRNRILETTLKSSLVFFCDWTHLIISRQFHAHGRLGLLACSSHSLYIPWRSLAMSFVTVAWTWGIWPQTVSGLPSQLQHWKTFSPSQPGGIQ